MVLSVFLCCFYVINIMWCLAMKKILDNEEKLNDQSENDKSNTYSLTNEDEEVDL